MPPTLKRSSIRYLPARVSPSKGSPLVSSAAPSTGQRVLVSEYSVPQRGHFFILGWRLWLSFNEFNQVPGAYHTVSETIKVAQAVSLGRRIEGQTSNPQTNSLLYTKMRARQTQPRSHFFR